MVCSPLLTAPAAKTDARTADPPLASKDGGAVETCGDDGIRLADDCREERGVVLCGPVEEILRALFTRSAVVRSVITSTGFRPNASLNRLAREKARVATAHEEHAR